MQGETSAPAAGPPQRMFWGIRRATGAQRCSAWSQSPIHWERASRGRLETEGRGGEEDGSAGSWTRLSLHRGSRLTQLCCHPVKKRLRARPSHLQYILYILL